MVTIITTKRLVLRPFTDSDKEASFKINNDPEVMKHFPAPLTEEENDKFVERLKAGIAERGWGFWAATVDDELIGMIGIAPIVMDTHFSPSVEVGWRLGKKFWGKGYATEGAAASLQYGFETLNLPEIVAITATTNFPSMKVMERLRMNRNPSDDFDNPKLAKDHPLCRHVLYRLKKSEWSDYVRT